MFDEQAFASQYGFAVKRAAEVAAIMYSGPHGVTDEVYPLVKAISEQCSGTDVNIVLLAVSHFLESYLLAAWVR